jgi:hypothetical protein
MRRISKKILRSFIFCFGSMSVFWLKEGIVTHCFRHLYISQDHWLSRWLSFDNALQAVPFGTACIFVDPLMQLYLTETALRDIAVSLP